MNTLSLFNLCSNLANADDAQYITTVRKESIMEKTGKVSLVGYILALEINYTAKSPIINLEKVLSYCVISNIEKSNFPLTKSEEERDELQLWKIINTLGYDLQKGIGFNIFNDWSSAEEVNNKEGFVLRLATAHSEIHKIWEESVMLRNRFYLKKSEYVQGELGDLSAKCEFTFENQPEVQQYLTTQITNLTKTLDTINSMSNRDL